MKVFHIVGWKQFKGDCATKIERWQIADSGDEALEHASRQLCPDDNWRAVLEFKELEKL